MKIIGNTVGTPTSPAAMGEKLDYQPSDLVVRIAMANDPTEEGVFSITHDKSFEEIEEAYQSGRNLVCDLDGTLIAYAGCDGTSYLFSNVFCDVGVFGFTVYIRQSGSYLKVHFIPEIEDVPTDDHINELIDTKLGVIENGTY